ncbi:hypothetical protein [Vagococcus carniphilus]|uniref:hypothetical protein n=1 Tax=Vagococcus carniphilus TaxID=218144 RepID=UPI0028909F7D|nr:hypothetical protein [Vagococcus carniphilus]MDT2865450.1 hypothetical protein [Vagococcus carniphilus]
MFKIMYVPKELRHLNYRELLNRQIDTLEQTEALLQEARENKKATDMIQADMLKVLANLNKCSEEDLKEMQLMTENYMKVAINKS